MTMKVYARRRNGKLIIIDPPWEKRTKWLGYVGRRRGRYQEVVDGVLSDAWADVTDEYLAAYSEHAQAKLNGVKQ
jgi:hypothetical protein